MSLPPASSLTQVQLASYGIATLPARPPDRYLIDCRYLRDPQGIAGKKFPGAAFGAHPQVQAWISADPRVRAILDEVLSLVHAHVKVGKENYVTFGFFDRAGIWIAPAVVELARGELEQASYAVFVKHHATH